MGTKPHATEVDLYVIEKVKEMRKKAQMRQIDLAQHLGMADSFVSNVESSKRRDKYNIRHLNELAKVFNCSPRDFLPERPL
jgi:transcriptional regulator with XRE-family HTH domain